MWQLGWPEFSEGNSRLIASFAGVSILCLRGLAIQPISTPGFSGVIELESAETDVSRNRVIGADITQVIDMASITAPDNVQVVSCASLLATVSGIKTVFLTFNLGPWTAMKKWAAAQGPLDPSEIAVALDDAGQRGPDYNIDREKMIGSLKELWERCYDSPLFGTLIDVISQAWQVSPSELIVQVGWEHEGNTIYGRFFRQ